MNGTFTDRREAGMLLSEELTKYAGRNDVLVMGLPRGGVPVAFEVAARLGLPLEVLVVRKLGLPGHEELAMGAVASGGVRVLNNELVDRLGITPEVIERVTAAETGELERRERLYRDHRPFPELKRKVVILVDDGVATGSTMFAAIEALREHQVAKVVIAVPVAPDSTLRELEWVADEAIVLTTPVPFYGVGQFYGDFSPTTDEQVRRLLGQANMRSSEPRQR